MKDGIHEFNHLAAWGIAEARVPVREAIDLLSASIQLEVLDEVMVVRQPKWFSLAELPEGKLSRVNYAESVRGRVETIWQPLAENPQDIPSFHLLEELNTSWNKAEKEIGSEAEGAAAQIFAGRTREKAENIEIEANRLACERGLPAAVEWLEGLKAECGRLRKLRVEELASYSNRKKHHADTLEQIKEDWVNLLGEDEWDPKEVAFRFLILASGVATLGLLLWLIRIPLNSVGGLLAMSLLLFLGSYAVRPLLRHLRGARRTTRLAGRLVAAYKSLSFFSLDETTKRQEVEFSNTLRTEIALIQEKCQKRIGLLEMRRAELRDRRDTTKAALLQGPATLCPLLREGALEEWHGIGKSQAPRTEWGHQLVCLKDEPTWGRIDEEAREAFSFLKEVRAEEELFSIYPAKEDRLAFLKTLREATIGRTPGEACLSLDFSAMGGGSPEVNLIVEVDNPERSNLAKEINEEWANAGVGVSIVQSLDPGEITLIGIVYGYPLVAIKEWEAVEGAFKKAKEREGEAIYPVLFPETAKEKA